MESNMLSEYRGWHNPVSNLTQDNFWNTHQNIRESILDFTARLGEINPDMPYLCRRGSSGLKRAVFAFFPSVRRESMKKTLNLRFFAKKQVNFWAVYLLRRKSLIINENTMMRRENLGRFQVILNSLKSPILLLF